MASTARSAASGATTSALADRQVPLALPPYGFGFNGGQALADTELNADAAKVLGAAVLLALVVPVWSYAILRTRVQPFDAAAIAATHGSVSAVTFVAASQFLASRGDTADGYLTVALVVGAVSGPDRGEAIAPFVGDIFTGDAGPVPAGDAPLLVARQLRGFETSDPSWRPSGS